MKNPKQKLKNILLLVTVLFAFSCSKDAYEEHLNLNTRDYHFKKINFQELRNINNQAFIETVKLKKVLPADKHNTIETISGFDIDLQSIQYLKKTNNEETFSFRVLQSANATFSQNILIDCKSNQSPQTYLITYYLNKQLGQISNNEEFMNSITSTSTTRLNSSSSNVTNSISCVQVGYYDYEDYCERNLDTRPHCYNSDGSRRKILVFKVIAADCSVGGSNDFIPDAQVWMNNHQNPSNPSSGNYSNGLGGGGENSLNIDIFIPNYFNSEDLSNPSTQNMLQINQFIYNLYASNNTIKGVVESTEWLLAYTNYWIGVNGGLISSNQNALTYAFNNMSSVFYQYPDTINTQAQISLFQYNAFQFLLQHGLWLSGQSETTQQSIKNYLIANCFSDESEEFANDLIDSGYNSNDNTIIYSQTNYPGINDNMPFEWWKDDTYLNNNITLSPTNSNTYPDLTDSEVLLCGLFPLAALTINSNVDNAFNMAQVKLPTLNGRNDKKDAFRHAFFNAINTRDVLLSKGVPGRVIVRLFGKAHEQTNPPGPALEKEMDLFNNDRGINSCTTCYPGIDSDLEIANNIMQLLGGGSLLYLFPLGSDNLIISTTQLIPTNQ